MHMLRGIQMVFQKETGNDQQGYFNVQEDKPGATNSLFKILFTHCEATNTVTGSINQKSLQINSHYTFASMLFVQSHHKTIRTSKTEEVQA